MYFHLLKKGNGYILEVDDQAHCIAYWDAGREKDMFGYAEIICIHSLQDLTSKGAFIPAYFFQCRLVRGSGTRKTWDRTVYYFCL